MTIGVTPLQGQLRAELRGWLTRLNDEFLPLEAYVERFHFNLAASGHPIHNWQVGVHDPDNEK
jgi:hypothetical protein